jgi:hypothetical protein
MQPSSYEGPRHGDYVRYVDELLRASPLYQSAAQGWMVGGRCDFSDALATPGSQPLSVAERVRAQVQALAAQAAAQQASAPSSQAPARGRAAAQAAAQAQRARQEAARASRKAAPARGGKPTWFRLGPSQWLGIVIGLILAVVIPGIGPFILLLTIIHAVAKGVRNGMKASK